MPFEQVRPLLDVHKHPPGLTTGITPVLLLLHRSCHKPDGLGNNQIGADMQKRNHVGVHIMHNKNARHAHPDGALLQIISKRASDRIMSRR